MDGEGEVAEEEGDGGDVGGVGLEEAGEAGSPLRSVLEESCFVGV